MDDSQPPIEIKKSPQDNTIDSSDNLIANNKFKPTNFYEHLITHICSIKLVSNHFKFLTTLKFTLSPSNHIVFFIGDMF